MGLTLTQSGCKISAGDDILNFDVLHFEEITSTSDYIKDNISGLNLPAVVSADMQTRGRGRRGKSFYSPSGTGLYFSMGFEAKPEFDLITPAAAVCVCDSVYDITGISPDIKWVNDIYLNGSKICGILTERFVRDGKEVTVTGIGINLTTSVFPKDLPVAGSLGVDIKKELLRDRICSELLEMNESFDRADVIERYRKKLFILGKEITYEKNNVLCCGIASDINDDCNLKVITPDGTDILSSGEVSIKMR